MLATTAAVPSSLPHRRDRRPSDMRQIEPAAASLPLHREPPAPTGKPRDTFSPRASLGETRSEVQKERATRRGDAAIFPGAGGCSHQFNRSPSQSCESHPTGPTGTRVPPAGRSRAAAVVLVPGGKRRCCARSASLSETWSPGHHLLSM